MSQSNPKVFLGVGHGGKDPGAIANGLREADINLTIAIAAQAELVRHGCTVLLSRYINEDDSLSEEIQEANTFAPDLAVDIHNNAGGGNGFEAYYQTNGYTVGSRNLALCIEKEVKKIGQNSRGIKTRLNATGTDYFGFLRQVNTTTALVEGAFLDSTDRYIIDTAIEQQAFGVAYAKGILAFLGIQWQPVNEGADMADMVAKLEKERNLRQKAERATQVLVETLQGTIDKFKA